MPEIVYWIQSIGPEGKKRVKAYFEGTWKKDGPDGLAGDVKLRPFKLGPGPFTFTVSPDTVETEDGSPFQGA